MMPEELAVAVGVGTVGDVVADPHWEAVGGVVVTVWTVVFVASKEGIEVPGVDADAHRNVSESSKHVGHGVAQVVMEFVR